MHRRQVTWTLDNLDRFDREEDGEPDDILAQRLRWLVELLSVVVANSLNGPVVHATTEA
ncbi:hypothetical protein [Cellulomonas triticagri]|uniref:hypothetical protein n=1 Tax=Cellulomonas triticagri TaxID=2483352 RepID=UPI00131563C1|nr:hypothetical protein [Cellulomonas triticagri]